MNKESIASDASAIYQMPAINNVASPSRQNNDLVNVKYQQQQSPFRIKGIHITANVVEDLDDMCKNLSNSFRKSTGTYPQLREILEAPAHKNLLYLPKNNLKSSRSNRNIIDMKAQSKLTRIDEF